MGLAWIPAFAGMTKREGDDEGVEGMSEKRNSL
jgi:hypothetical protein